MSLPAISFAQVQQQNPAQCQGEPSAFKRACQTTLKVARVALEIIAILVGTLMAISGLFLTPFFPVFGLVKLTLGAAILSAGSIAISREFNSQRLPR